MSGINWSLHLPLSFPYLLFISLPFSNSSVLKSLYMQRKVDVYGGRMASQGLGRRMTWRGGGAVEVGRVRTCIVWREYPVKGVSQCWASEPDGVWRVCRGSLMWHQSASTVGRVSQWRVDLVWATKAQAEKRVFLWEKILKWRVSKIALRKFKQARKTLLENS